MKYLVGVEETETGFSTYSPDLPGCIATEDIREEVENNMQEGILTKSWRLVPPFFASTACAS